MMATATKSRRQSNRTVEIPAYPEQARFLASTASNVIFQGGARSGKTWAGVLKALLMLCEHPGVWGMYIAPTYKQLQQAAEPHFLALGYKLGLTGQWQWNRQEGRITHPNGGVLLLRSAENPEALLGATLGWAVCDEVGLWRKQAYDYLQDRLSDPRGPRQAYFTFTPKGTAHWSYKVLGVERDGIEIIRTSTGRNPTLPADYHERLRREHGEGTQWWRQEVLGEYVAWEGQVYPQFDEARHVREAPDREQFVWVIGGIDWGWTNPGVMLVMGLDENNVAWVVDEVYEREKSIEWWAETGQRLQERWGVEYWFADPSQPANIAALAQKGLAVRRANNEILPGIMAVASRFANDQLFLAPKATNTAAEILTYCWKQRNDGTVRFDEPEDLNNHACDTIRYEVMGLLHWR
jgi:PBSX family phage terminase large subunit